MYTYQQVYDSSLEYFGGDELAVSVFAGKYALQDESGNYLELTPDDMHKRLAKEFARIEQKYDNPMSFEEIYGLFQGFRFVVPQGSPMSGVGNETKIQSLSNCFVIESPADSYAGILKTDQEQVQIMKRRGGVGFDISTIRPKGMVTSNAAKTTDGIEVFLDRFSNSCREVAQNGRRGALMLSISVHHPQVLDFIKIKRDLTRVTGANISVRVTDEFMNAVKNNEHYTVRWPVDAENPEVHDHLEATKVWNELIEGAHASAEPGVLFWDTAKRMTPSDAYSDVGFGSVSTNPCIIGSSIIATADGRNGVSIEQLANEGQDIPVYSTDTETGQVVIKMGRNPRKTGEKKEVWKLTLDDGTSLTATPDHKILTKDMKYVELSKLKEGQSLFPFNSFNSNGYRQISNVGKKMSGGARRNRRQYRLIHEFYYGEINAKKYAIHHADFNSKNDRLENLEIMLHEDHQRLHSDRIKGDNNPYHKMSKEWKHNFASHPGESNGRYSGYTNDQLIEEGRKVYEKHGKLSIKGWANHAKQIGAPQFLNNEFRFGSWSNFKSLVVNNHKVASVEFVGHEDVYNITVDDNHNYFVLTSNEDKEFVKSSGIAVKNCGEIILSPYDSCRLMLMNLTSFVDNPWTKEASFDWGKFRKYSRKAQRLMDDMIDLEIEQIDKILAKIESDPEDEKTKFYEKNLWETIRTVAVNGRRTGLGVTGLGDTIAMLGQTYGSDASIETVEEIYKWLTLASYEESIQLAKERGAFEIFNHRKEKVHPYLKRVISELTPEVVEDYRTYGRRNIANTTTAPAGSVSCLTQTTSGIEPAFMLYYKRRKKVQDGEEVMFVDDLGDEWTEFNVYHHGFKQWLDSDHGTTASESDLDHAVAFSPYHGATANEIDWRAKVKLQSVAQKWICHAISNTTNLPADIDVETVKDIYMLGWELGCKGVTVYRDGSRSGVLVSTDDKKEDENTIIERDAPKRPEALDCDIYHTSVKGQKWVVLIGLLEGKPYEVIGGEADQIEIPTRYKSGKLQKRVFKTKNSKYDLTVGKDDNSLVIKDVVSVFDNPNHAGYTRVISTSLRHGVPVQYLVEQMQKDKEMDMFSFSKVISRCLKNYIVDGTKVKKKCPHCGAEGSLVYQEGCVTCKSCGSSKCG